MYDTLISTVTKFTGYVEVHRFRKDIKTITWVSLIDQIKLKEQGASTFTLKDV